MSQIESISIRFLILFCCLNICLGQGCGRSNSTNRIVGGQNASPLEWPWMALLKITFQSTRSRKISGCGGTLISDQWIVTAAHCTSPPPGFKLTALEVTLGEQQINTFEGTEVKTYGSEVYTKGFNPSAVTNDIALIKINRRLNFNGEQKNLQPICLPSDDLIIDGNRCFATGWGTTVASGSQGANVLQKVRIPILENDYCERVVNRWANFRSQYQLCAGYKEGGHDTCQGDSGGPLNCPLSNGVWVLQGITSFGNGCAQPRSPGVYTRVSAYIPWIRSVTRSNFN